MHAGKSKLNQEHTMEIVNAINAPPEISQQLHSLRESMLTELRSHYVLIDKNRKPSEEPGLQTLVALRNGKVVAALDYKIENDSCSLRSIVTHPSFREHGFASSLIQEVEKIAREQYLDSLYLYTVKETGAYKAFEKLGFATVETFQSDLFVNTQDKSPVTEIKMELPLWTGRA